MFGVKTYNICQLSNQSGKRYAHKYSHSGSVFEVVAFSEMIIQPLIQLSRTYIFEVKCKKMSCGPNFASENSVFQILQEAVALYFSLESKEWSHRTVYVLETKAIMTSLSNS